MYRYRKYKTNVNRWWNMSTNSSNNCWLGNEEFLNCQVRWVVEHREIAKNFAAAFLSLCSLTFTLEPEPLLYRSRGYWKRIVIVLFHQRFRQVIHSGISKKFPFATHKYATNAGKIFLLVEFRTIIVFNRSPNIIVDSRILVLLIVSHFFQVPHQIICHVASIINAWCCSSCHNFRFRLLVEHHG